MRRRTGHGPDLTEKGPRMTRIERVSTEFVSCSQSLAPKHGFENEGEMKSYFALFSLAPERGDSRRGRCARAIQRMSLGDLVTRSVSEGRIANMFASSLTLRVTIETIEIVTVGLLSREALNGPDGCALDLLLKRIETDPRESSRSASSAAHSHQSTRKRHFDSERPEQTDFDAAQTRHLLDIAAPNVILKYGRGLRHDSPPSQDDSCLTFPAVRLHEGSSDASTDPLLLPSLFTHSWGSAGFADRCDCRRYSAGGTCR